MLMNLSALRVGAGEVPGPGPNPQSPAGSPKSLSTAPLEGLPALALVGAPLHQCPEWIPPQTIRVSRLT